MSRTLVSVQTISRIEPILGADRIVLAHVLGWKVIISKDMHLSVGDKVAYFETDSLLPESDPRYTQFMPRGVRHVRLEDGAMVTGHVLRTMKMRGVYSQGLIMPLPELGIDPTHPDWRDACELAHRYFTSRIGGLSVFDIGVGMCVQAEYAGPGINGNRQKLAKRDLFVFAVWQDGEKLPRDEWEDSFLAHAAPEVNPWEYPITSDMDTLISAVDGMRGHITPNMLDEGIVWHLDPDQPIPNNVREALGDNLCFKIINNTYLAKHHL